jgi:hypothetical protein
VGRWSLGFDPHPFYYLTPWLLPVWGGTHDLLTATSPPPSSADACTRTVFRIGDPGKPRAWIGGRRIT